MRHNPLLYCIKELNSLLNGVYNTHTQNSEIGPPPLKSSKKKNKKPIKIKNFLSWVAVTFFLKKTFENAERLLAGGLPWCFFFVRLRTLCECVCMSSCLLFFLRAHARCMHNLPWCFFALLRALFVVCLFVWLVVFVLFDIPCPFVFFDLLFTV